MVGDLITVITIFIILGAFTACALAPLAQEYLNRKEQERREREAKKHL